MSFSIAKRNVFDFSCILYKLLKWGLKVFVFDFRLLKLYEKTIKFCKVKQVEDRQICVVSSHNWCCVKKDPWRCKSERFTRFNFPLTSKLTIDGVFLSTQIKQNKVDLLMIQFCLMILNCLTFSWLLLTFHIIRCLEKPFLIIFMTEHIDFLPLFKTSRIFVVV